MTPLLLSLLCAASPAPVEAPRPSAEPIAIRFRFSERGRVLCAPAVRTTSGRTATVSTGDCSICVMPIRQSDGRVQADVLFAENPPDGLGRINQRLTMRVEIHSGDTIALDWGGPTAGGAQVTIEQPGKPAAVVPLRPSR